MYPFEKIEKKWSKKWKETGIYEPDLDKAKNPFYNLMMFPYPSAEGLHIGSVRTFSGVDVYGRFKRMQGHDVFEPIGLDGFGIHSENYALKIGKHVLQHAQDSQENFYRQLDSIGNSFAWNERLETYDKDYYKWTQWLFIQMYKQGLAYKAKSDVNWCPSCKTVLADEQVEKGECERCKNQVTKKELEQWFFKITDYADRLLENLETIDWSEHIKLSQKNWIGKSEGASINFPVKDENSSIEVFTTRPDTIFGATYMVLAPEHSLVDELKEKIENFDEVSKYIEKAKSKTENERIADVKDKTGVELRGVKAINPANNEPIPIYIADYVLSGYGTGAIMAVPGQDERDWEFAEKFDLPIVRTVEPPKDFEGKAYTGEGKAINSDFLDGLNIGEAKVKIINWLEKNEIGSKETNYHLRDWLISRQRYWGPPIPMIYCDKCNWQPVPEKDLPVELPEIDDFEPSGDGSGPLASVPEFYETKCPECGGDARRETDVSDTFLDSSWYFLRYVDVDNSKKAFSKKRIKKWLPVDMYIGGAEHAVLHLLYARFVTMVLKDVGLIDFEEPFKKFRTHGMIIKDGMKMSKSRGNVINPDDYIGKFGLDAVRLYLHFLSPLPQSGDWRDSGLMGSVRFIDRLWSFFEDVDIKDEDMSDWMHPVVEKATNDMEQMKFNTVIAQLMTALREFEGQDQLSKGDIEAFLLMLAPIAPFISEELWEKIGNNYSIHQQSWPDYDEKKLISKEVDLVIQVNGKLRGTVKVEKGTSEDDALQLALQEERVQAALEDKEPKKVIYVQDKLINLVV